MKRLAPSPYSPGPEVSMACLERALTRCDTARCAVIGLHMRRHLRYFTPVFSVAFETQKFWHFSYLQVLKLTSPPSNATENTGVK
jgi:hypothetical protein